MKRFSRAFTQLIPVVLLIQALMVVYLIREVKAVKSSSKKLKKMYVSNFTKQGHLVQELLFSFEKTFKTMEFPPVIKHVPLADEEGIVLAVHPVDIPGVAAPYNASLIAEADRYFLFFRYDTPVLGNQYIPFHTNIGCTELDAQFHPTDQGFSRIETHSRFSEDPRVVQTNGGHFLVYNDLVQDPNTKHKSLRRAMWVANLDLQQKKINYSTCLDRHICPVEKNWMPFAGDGEGLHFIYSITPHEILNVALPQKGQITSEIPHRQQPILSQEDWPTQWGIPRGGTPAQLVDGEYLTFFHSAAEDHRGLRWYFMGAYTFKATAPYEITRISPYPILFKGIYDSPHENTSNKRIRSIYPAGFVVKNTDGKDLIHLSCGENDSKVKIVTLDKEALLKSLKKVVRN